MGGRSSFPMQTVPVGRRQALLHRRSVPPRGLLSRSRTQIHRRDLSEAFRSPLRMALNLRSLERRLTSQGFS